jgi:hypothetical protein
VTRTRALGQHGRQRKRQRLRGSASPRGSTGGDRWRRGAGQPWPSASSSWCESNQDKINPFAAATSSSTSAASDKCCCGSPPISRSSRAQRPPPAGAPPHSGGERMLFRAWDGETRPFIGRGTAPHFPDSPGGSDGSGLPGPLTAGRHVTTGKCRTVHKPPIHKPPRIRKREASRKVAPGCRARLPDLGTVDIRSASPGLVKPSFAGFSRCRWT